MSSSQGHFAQVHPSLIYFLISYASLQECELCSHFFIFFFTSLALLCWPQCLTSLVPLSSSVLPVTFFLYLSVSQAEARLAAKRAARAEAREIRMKELERQQKEVRMKVDTLIHYNNNKKNKNAFIYPTPGEICIIKAGYAVQRVN